MPSAEFCAVRVKPHGPIASKIQKMPPPPPIIGSDGFPFRDFAASQGSPFPLAGHRRHSHALSLCSSDGSDGRQFGLNAPVPALVRRRTRSRVAAWRPAPAPPAGDARAASYIERDADPATAAAPSAPATAPPAGAPAPATPSPLAHLRGTTQKANRIRQITAKKTRESLQTTAQLTQTHEVDMTKIVALRARAKTSFAEKEGVNLTYLPFIARAVIDALKAHPNINASYNEDTKEITYYDTENLGFAVDTEQGLLSPVVHNAGDLSLAGLARAIKDIAERARSGGLKPDELSGGTFYAVGVTPDLSLAGVPGSLSPRACDISGQALPGVSKWAFSYGAEYNVPAKLLEKDGQVYFGVDGNYRSS